MIRAKSYLSTLLILLFYLSVTFLYIRGIIHTYNSHGKVAFATSFFPPIGIYRGAENFWHKDEDKFENINWEKRLKSDVHLIILLMAANPKNDEMLKFNEVVEEYANKINQYPTERITFIKIAAKQYNRFLTAANTDITFVLNKIINEEKLDSANLSWSNNCKPILDSILRKYDIPELKHAYATMDSTIKYLLMNHSSNSFSALEKDKFIQSVRVVRQAEIDKINRTYKMIFDEDIK